MTGGGRVARRGFHSLVSKSKIAELIGSPRADAAYLVKKRGEPVKVIATEQGAKRLREQLAPGGQQPSGVVADEFRAEILALLNSGRVRETGHVEVDVRDAIRLESLHGKHVYVVDAATYDPLEWGNGGGVTLRFPVYEQLPVAPESMKLLDLEAQHPGAHVQRNPDAYKSAQARLFPHG